MEQEKVTEIKKAIEELEQKHGFEVKSFEFCTKDFDYKISKMPKSEFDICNYITWFVYATKI